MSARLALFVLVALIFAAIPYALAQTATPATSSPVQAASSDEGVIGTVLEIEGTATITPQDGTAKEAAVNAPVHLNDVVETGAKSRVFILLIDNTQWTLSENTKLAVDQWVYDPDDTRNNKGRYSVLQGAFEYVSGMLAKKKDPDVQIETQVGSIGIRGTDITGGDVDGTYGIQVDDGAIDVKTDAGQVRVNKGEGTTLKGRAFAPEKPGKWQAERLQRIRQQVYLQHRDHVQQRMAQMQARHGAMRQNYKQFMKAHPEAQQRYLQRQQRMQERRGEIQQQRGQFRGQKMEQRQQFLQKREERREQQGQLGWRPNQGKPGNGPFGGLGKQLKEQMQAQQNGQGAQTPAQNAQANRKEKLEELKANRRKRWQELKDQQQQGEQPQDQQQQQAPQ